MEKQNEAQKRKQETYEKQKKKKNEERVLSKPQKIEKKLNKRKNVRYISPFETDWKIDESKEILEKLSQLNFKNQKEYKSKGIVTGINQITKLLENSPEKLKLILISDAQHEKVPKIMTEHIKQLCVMKKSKFLNLNCSRETLGSIK
eukprot:gene2460-3170_t